MAKPTAFLVPLVLVAQLAGGVNVEDWFLTDAEIAAESGGRSRSKAVGDFPGLTAWTAGNAVEFIPDGSVFFAKLKQDIDSSGEGHKIYGSGWTFAPDLDLVPDSQDHEHGNLYDCLSDGTLANACDLLGKAGDDCEVSILGAAFPIMTGADAGHKCCAETSTDVGDPLCTSAAGVFSRANTRGVDIKLLVWNNGIPGTSGSVYLEYGQERMNKLFQEKSGSKSVYALDGRTHDTSKSATAFVVPRSVHTKHFSFVDGQGKATVSYAGGIDVGTCRYDVSDAQRRLQDGRSLSIQEDCTGWLDQSVRIQGPGAADIANSFVQRWNWKGDLNHPQAKGNTDEFDSRFAEVDPSVTTSAPAGDQYVQVLRTFGCDASQPFTQCGEYTILAALLKVIKAATRFFFVEDQYGFDVTPIREALSDALDRGVKVIAVLNGIGAEIGNTFCGDNLETMWSSLKSKGAYVFQYNKAEYGDYVHSKTWVVDDCWFMTGSANLNWRSMTADPELSVAVMESTCTAWVKRARCELWAELTTKSGVTADSICTMAAGSAGQIGATLDYIFGADGDQTQKLQPLVLGSSGDGLVTQWLQFICSYTDPDARCKESATCDYDDAFDSSYCAAGEQDYSLSVTTANDWWSGTDVNVDIRLWGSSGSSGWVRLNTLSSADLFERGDRNEFHIQTCNIGELTGFELDMYGFDSWWSGWKLDNVAVEGCGILSHAAWIQADTHTSLTKLDYLCPGKVWSAWSAWSAWQYACPHSKSTTRSKSCNQGGLSCGTQTDSMTQAAGECMPAPTTYPCQSCYYLSYPCAAGYDVLESYGGRRRGWAGPTGYRCRAEPDCVHCIDE
jgi:phosphatidylserine/phosphatidylglycerophosphate/cardiolipin synthase-like enzyme